jgi:DNA modification methylase
MLEIDKVYNEDCLITMARMPKCFVDLTVTSPPYDNLRTYNGYSFDFEGISNELYRVTKLGGVVVWVVNDATIDGDETGTSFRQALYFKKMGFNLYDTMIFRKVNYQPLKDVRYGQEFEYMFVLSKGKPKTFNPITIACKNAGKVNSGWVWNKDGTKKDKGGTGNIKDTKNHGNIWSYIVGRNDNEGEHPAVFPAQLVTDHIISWSNEGDLVYDPFSGSGTTMKSAILNKRHYICSEISENYSDMINRKAVFTKWGLR